MGLELYGEIEALLGFEKERELLYKLFLEKLKSLGIKEILDLGCGSGRFMELAQDAGFSVEGVDLSQEMVKRAKQKGLKASCQDVCSLTKKYEAVVAIFDVINYIPLPKLQNFYRCIANVLKEGGYFLCDINTLYGFEEVAQGALWIDKEERFVAIEADFDGKELKTKMVSFLKSKNCYQKQKDTITQYYHDIKELKFPFLELIDIDFVTLFGENPDKAILVYKEV